MVMIKKEECDLARVHQVILSHVVSEEDIQRFRVEGDAELFREAYDWLRAHLNYGLIDVGFHQPGVGSSREEGARLMLYVEPL